MWKKLLIVLITLMGVYSLRFIIDNKNLSAASSYSVGGSVTAKLGEMGLYPNGIYGNMSKGDKVYVSDHNGTSQSFILLLNETYNTYRLSQDSSGNYSLDTSVPDINGWFAMGNESIDTSFFSSFPSLTNVQYYGCVDNYLTTNSLVANKLLALNSTISKKGKEIIIPRNLNFLLHMYDLCTNTNSPTAKAVLHNIKEILNVSYSNPNGFFIGDEFTMQGSSGTNAIKPTISGYSLTAKDLSFIKPYYATYLISRAHDNNKVDLGYIKANGEVTYFTMTPSSFSTAASIRASAELDMSKVVFATGIGQGSTYSKVKNSSPNLNISYSDIYTVCDGYDNLKLRILDDTGNHSIVFTGIKNKNNNIITKAAKDSTIYLEANAAAGTSDGDINTVSALLFKNNALAYYIPVATAKGLDKYKLDLTGIDLGEYKIALVNEGYNESTMEPAKSSALSAYYTLEIVEPHKLTYTKTPQKGASDGKEYEFSKNVNEGQAVGQITVNPYGVMPLTYTLESNGGDTYQNFEISGLNKSGASSSSTLSVVIKKDAPDIVKEGKEPNVVKGGLKAGTYSFCISAVDDNGDPISPTTDSKVCTIFEVEKTDPTIEFDNPKLTKKSISDAESDWSETASANPNIGAKITYSLSGGDISLIKINKNTGVITYIGDGGFGKVTIKATIDDDPSTGDDNYNKAEVEKEIVIYREVDGHVTPHSNSSSTTTPTFTASDENIKKNGTIGTIQGTKGTPDTIEGTTTTYTYGIKEDEGEANFFSVDEGSGVITSKANLGVQSYHITVTVSDKWSTKEIPVTINVGVAAAEDLRFYENSTSNTVIASKSVKATDTGVSVYATVKGSSNTNPVTYKIKDGSTNVIEVNPNSGAITIHGVGTVTIVAEKQGATGQANAQTELTFTVTAGDQEFIYTDAGGNELPKANEKYNAYEEVYKKDKTFQLYTSGNPTGSTVTYNLKGGSPTDVISVDSDGLVHILNASLNNQMGKVIVEATSHDPSGNYADKTIELPINIKKADQTISFKDVTYAVSGKGKVTPIINEQDISSNDGGVQVNDTDYYITIDSSINTSIAWTNNGVDIEYNYSENEGIDIPLHVEKAGNRNYNKAEADGMMHIMGPDESTLAINRPGKIIYGDHFTIRSLQDDSSSTNVKYTFEVDNTTYISNPTVNGNSAEFDALKYSGTTNITIKVTRTADGETPLSKTISVQVLPKPIEIVIDDKEKYKGEPNPTLTYQDFRNQLVSWNGVKDSIQEKDIKLSTTAKTNSNAGSYPIKGDANTLNKTYPNYSFTFKEGTLTIKEENVEDDWYHLELDDGSSTAYTGSWTNKDVNIVSDHSEYINLSLDQSTWKPNQVTVTKEGETNQSFWMKKDSGAITKEKQEIIRIDKTAPKVKGIKAKDTNNKLQDIINKLSGGIFFKPGTSFEITTSDKKDDLKVSGTKEIAYKVYKMTDDIEEEIKNGTLAVTKEKASITISETVGKYKVCVIPTDNAGNTNSESCHEVELKKIDIDVDGDGKPDFNDPDGDGCPDLNIKWKDPNDENKWIVINGDRNYDGIPDLNIDSDGDGKPDLNIDTDNDGKPDLNLVILKKSDWKPTKCVKADPDNGILEEYCTGTSVKAVINKDTDNDYIPNVNIDTNGDMKADINISKDDTKPIINIVELTNWVPNKNYTHQKFIYDTMKDIIPLLNIDTDGDGRPDVNVDLNDDGIPDINIDVDHDGIPDIDIDSDGDGEPDVNVDTDSDGKPDENIIEIKEWKPNKNVDGDLPYDTMDFSKADEPNASDEPDTSVKGQYNPSTSMGGANTGDTTNFMLYASICCLALGAAYYIIYKKKTDF